MSEYKDENFTLELKEVLDYMTNTLINEFPTNVVSPEYLILSILDSRNNHANMLLDNCLMSDNLEELRKIYVSVVESHMRPQLRGTNISFNSELLRLLDASRDEAKKMSNNKVGTEHILLAILNKENHFRARDVFEKFRLEYEFIYDKCNTTGEKINKKLSLKIKNKQNSKKEPNNDIPLKSQVNTKIITNQGMGQYMKQYTVSINQKVRDGEADDVIGRESEINEMIKVLSRRKKNNVVLVGNGGCGKTCLVYKLAKMIEEDSIPSVLEGKEIVMLNIMAIVSGTHFRGMFEERMNGLFNELQNNDKYILFIDDIHNVLKSGTKDKDTDISGMIGNILSEGKTRVIGTTTFKDYRNTIENNSSISRKLQKIVIEPSTNAQTFDIVMKNKKYYEDFHNVHFSEKTVKKAVDLAERYISDRCLPDSALDVIDTAGASIKTSSKEPIEIINLKKRFNEIEEEKYNALNNGDFESVDSLNNEENAINAKISEYKRKTKSENEIFEVTEDDVANVVSELTKIPVSKLSSNEKSKIANIDKILKESVVGQDEAVNSICQIIKRNKVGLGDKNHPLGVFLLLGPTGSGKSLIAKKLAEEIFGDEKALIRIDMSEYSEKSSVAKLIGSAPGYIGYENGGQLTEAVKHKQYCVLLLDEIEKAHQEVYNIFLQLFDEGRLTDSSGQIVNFKNVIVLMTSNIGARKASEIGGGVGFITNEDDNKKSIIEKELKKTFSPEFINRIDKIVYFNNLTNDNLRDIVKLEINKFNKRLNNIDYNISYNEDVINYIHSKAIEQKEFGARPIIRLIQTNIEDKITELMLTNDYPQNYQFTATCVENEIKIQ